MKIEYDTEKNARNIRERGLSFDVALLFKWDTALIIEDVRKDYGEPRFRALGFIESRLHALVFTPRDEAIRIISLRKANSREVRWYEKQTQL